MYLTRMGLWCMWCGNGMGACGYLGGSSICWGSKTVEAGRACIKCEVKIVMTLNSLLIGVELSPTRNDVFMDNALCLFINSWW